MEISKHFDICAGHRVIGQGGKCERSYHGHNYRVTIFVRPKRDLNAWGAVFDFGEIGAFGNFLEEVLDHRTIVWNEDPNLEALARMTPAGIVTMSANPTAENIGLALLNYFNQKPEQYKVIDRAMGYTPFIEEAPLISAGPYRHPDQVYDRHLILHALAQNIEVHKLIIEETRKCKATLTLKDLYSYEQEEPEPKKRDPNDQWIFTGLN